MGYRGPHGVRVVHNGTLDLTGAWIGYVGVGDAMGGSVKYVGTTLNDVDCTGKCSYQIDLDKIPHDTTDIFFSIVAPLGGVSQYTCIHASCYDADDLEHELACVRQGGRAPRPSMKELPDGCDDSLILCNLSHNKGQNTWGLTGLWCPSDGCPRDYRPMISLLRLMQARSHCMLAPWAPPSMRSAFVDGRRLNISRLRKQYRVAEEENEIRVRQSLLSNATMESVKSNVSLAPSMRRQSGSSTMEPRLKSMKTTGSLLTPQGNKTLEKGEALRESATTLGDYPKKGLSHLGGRLGKLMSSSHSKFFQ